MYLSLTMSMPGSGRNLAGVVALLVAACGSSQEKSPVPAEAAGDDSYIAVAASGERLYYYPGSGPVAYAAEDVGAFVVELSRAQTVADRRALAELGAVADEPNLRAGSRYLYRLTAAQGEKLLALDFVRSVERLDPADKLDPDSFASSGRVAITIDFITVSAAKLAAIGDLLESWGARIDQLDPVTARITIDRARLGDIGRISDVTWIEPNRAH